MAEVQIRPFQPHNQTAVRDLILAGLGDHYEVLDPSLNPDLEDIQRNYVEQGGCFLVVFDGCEIIGTGALIKESPGIGRIVRMSVSAERRRQGMARKLVQELMSRGRSLGYTKIVVETNDDWVGAIRLYKDCGFRSYDHRDGEIHMQVMLAKESQMDSPLP